LNFLRNNHISNLNKQVSVGFACGGFKILNFLHGDSTLAPDVKQAAGIETKLYLA
jgi:hypothetical protein